MSGSFLSSRPLCQSFPPPACLLTHEGSQKRGNSSSEPSLSLPCDRQGGGRAGAGDWGSERASEGWQEGDGAELDYRQERDILQGERGSEEGGACSAVTVPPVIDLPFVRHMRVDGE